tara:strand:- start:8 stop:175 length:168 start_codon:yes stop_codon:yes gene_type:complete
MKRSRSGDQLIPNHRRNVLKALKQRVSPLFYESLLDKSTADLDKLLNSLQQIRPG